jgi:trypsin
VRSNPLPTLIGPRKGLTAAHCLDGVSASATRFVPGASLSSPEYTLAVARLKMHPSYDSANITNDVGLVTLAADAPVASLPLLQSTDASWVGRKWVSSFAPFTL